MQEAVEREKACLCYGMLLTRVFEVFGISIKDESFKKILSHDEYYGQTLHKIKYWKICGY